MLEMCVGKNWWIRVPLLLLYLFFLIKFIEDPNYQSIVDPLNLGIHELGHIVFSFGGKFLSVAGGTLLQLLVPLVTIPMFLKQRDLFALSFSSIWLGINFFDIATYANDAQNQFLPLITLGDPSNVIHDWNYMLTKLHVLQHTDAIAEGIRFFGYSFLVLGIGWGVYSLWYIFTANLKHSNNHI